MVRGQGTPRGPTKAGENNPPTTRADEADGQQNPARDTLGPPRPAADDYGGPTTTRAVMVEPGTCQACQLNACTHAARPAGARV